jgi:flagellin-like hook-associated protein FlgL
MEGIFEALLRLEGAKHKALIQTDASAYEEHVRAQLRLLDSASISAADLETAARKSPPCLPTLRTRRRDDTTGIQTQLQDLQQIFSQLSTARTRVGGYMKLADGVSSHLKAGLLRVNVNEVQNADPAQSITELTLSQTNLQATLAVGARLTQLSLLDYL